MANEVNKGAPYYTFLLSECVIVLCYSAVREPKICMSNSPKNT